MIGIVDLEKKEPKAKELMSDQTHPLTIITTHFANYLQENKYTLKKSTFGNELK